MQSLSDTSVLGLMRF